MNEAGNRWVTGGSVTLIELWWLHAGKIFVSAVGMSGSKDLLNNLCRGRWKNGVIGQRGALWTDQSLLLLFFCTLYWDAKVYSSWKDHGWPAEEGCWRFTNSPFFLPSPSEIITWNRERKAVLTNGAVNKTLPLLSGWRAWNRVKNHSNVDFTEDKLLAEYTYFFWLTVIREFFLLK